MTPIRTLPLRLLALAAALLLPLAACAPAASPAPSQPSSAAAAAQPEAAPIHTLRIPWDPGDGLNPFTCQSLQNYYAAGLLYDTLVALDMVGAPQNRLAQEITLDGARCIVRLRTDARFSDGSGVTAQDVVYSARLAREAPRFSAQLAGVAEMTTPDRHTVVFTLLEPDQYFPRSLAFPVVKEGTGEDPLPLGGGRFVPDDTGAVMTRSTTYHTPVRNVRTVRLVDAGALSRQGAAVAAGELDLLYSDLRGAADLSLGLGRRQVVLSNLVYLGVNSRRRGFSAELRAAFSGIIDREAIARRAYRGFAAAAYSPIKQSFSMAAGGEEDPAPDPQSDLLDSLGYGERDEEGWRLYQRRRFTLRLLVNSDSPLRLDAAGLIVEAFADAGIQVLPETAPFEEYSQRIASGDYDLYLGELRISPNLDLLPLIAPDEAVGPGCVRDEELLELYRRVKAGEEELSALDQALRRTVPAIPLVYRRGVVAFSPDFSANIVATEQDIFYNIGEW